MNTKTKVFLLLIAVFAFTGPLYAQETDPLIQAYQKEFVFLDNEIRLLRDRLAEVEADGEERIAKSNNKIEKLEAELLAISSEVDKKNDELRIVEEERNTALDSSDTLISILEQATNRLKNYGVDSFAEANTSQWTELSREAREQEELAYVFDKSFEILKDLGEIRTAEGTFYLKNGNQAEGTLIHVGNIASYGISGAEGGTLIPAGGGKLQVSRPETLDTARQLEAGSMPEVLPIFLYESLDKAVETAAEKTIRKTIEGGGIIGYVIIGIGGIALLLILIRIVILFIVSRRNDKQLDHVNKEVENKNLDGALAESRKMPGAIGRVISATVGSLKEAPEKVEDAIAESVLNEQPRLQRFRSALSVFAAVAPLLGLLGTVTGMISTFDVITTHGTGDPKLLSGGISEALITTELGLTVAIPTLLIGNLLAAWADRINSNLEVSALRVINIEGGFESSKAVAT